MALMPPGGARPWVMNWLGFGTPGTGGCWGSKCSVSEPRRWAEGYSATVMSEQVLSGVWTLKMVDGKPVDLAMIRCGEFREKEGPRIALLNCVFGFCIL